MCWIEQRESARRCRPAGTSSTWRRRGQRSPGSFTTFSEFVSQIRWRNWRWRFGELRLQPDPCLVREKRLKSSTDVECRWVLSATSHIVRMCFDTNSPGMGLLITSCSSWSPQSIPCVNRTCCCLKRLRQNSALHAGISGSWGIGWIPTSQARRPRE
jgi:hypothetical protein